MEERAYGRFASSRRSALGLIEARSQTYPAMAWARCFPSAFAGGPHSPVTTEPPVVGACAVVNDHTSPSVSLSFLLESIRQ